MIPFLTQRRVGKIRYLRVCMPLYLWECPGLFSDRSLHTGTAPAPRNTTRVFRGAGKASIASGRVCRQEREWPLVCEHISESLPSLCGCSPSRQELIFIVFCFLPSLVKLIVAPSKMQPLDVYSHLGPAIKMMNELASCPCKGGLRVDIDTQKIISLFRPFSVFNPVPQAPR